MSRMDAALARKQSQRIATPKPLPSPVGGWVTAQNLAASSEGTCIVLDNGYCTTRGVRARGGNQLFATTGTEPVESLIVYQGATVSKMFASSDGDIFDITSPADPEVAPAPDVTGQTSDYYAHVNFATTGGYFLYAVNGTDDALLYDGSTWTPINGASTPAITGATTSTFSHVNVYRNRLYFVEKNSLTVHYLPVDSIGGAASQLSLSGIFRKGGAVFFTATWSSESGSNSLNDYLMVVSTEGEIAIFQGSFPGGIDWTLSGVAEGPEPLGINGWMKAGGDIAILTERGWIAGSAIRFKDPAALSIDALSSAIEPDWTREARLRRSVPWEVAKWETKGLAYVNTPVTSTATPPITFIKNLQTGAWSRYTNWDNRCVIVFNNQMYFGTNTGTVHAAEIGGYDVDQPYTMQLAYAWNHLGTFGSMKTVMQVRAELLTSYPVAVRITNSTEYVVNWPSPPNVDPDTIPASVYDIGLYDSAVFDAGTVQMPKTTHWITPTGSLSGRVHSLGVQIPVGGTNTLDTELLSLVATVDMGALVV